LTAACNGRTGREILAAAAGGAVAGGMAGLTMGVSLAAGIAGTGLAFMAGYGTNQLAAGKPATLEGYAYSGIVGAVSYTGNQILGKMVNEAVGFFGNLPHHTSGFDPVRAITKAATYTNTTGQKNFSIGTASASEANALGRAWVGEGYHEMLGGGGLVSADGTRTYRFPAYKSSTYATTGVQANFERLVNNRVISNGHLNIE
jgi:hypothetical protein